MTKEQLEYELYERMFAENEKYLSYLKTRPAAEIISHAHEIATREDILILFENETSFSQPQLEVLSEYGHPLAELYNDWNQRDTDEFDLLLDSVVSHLNDILNDRAETKYTNPAQPMYEKTRDEAYICGEGPEWWADHIRSRECSSMFQEEGEPDYQEHIFPAFLKRWETAFGKERCMFVLACTMQQRDGDERFYPPAREAAAKCKAQLERIGNHVDDYAVDTHSSIVNAAMEYLARPERSKEKSVVQKKKTQPER